MTPEQINRAQELVREHIKDVAERDAIESALQMDCAKYINGTLVALDYCIRQLQDDRKIKMGNEACEFLTYREILIAMVKARATIKALEGE